MARHVSLEIREKSLGEHRADICVLNKLVIEFQNSPLSLNDWNERIDFYSKNHNLIFVVNAMKKDISIKYYLILNGTFNSEYNMKNPFRGIPNPSNYYLFFQIEENKIIWVSNNINNSWTSFEAFMELTKEEFINVAREIAKNKLLSEEDKFLYYKECYYFKLLERKFKRKFERKISRKKVELQHNELSIRKAQQYIRFNMLNKDLSDLDYRFRNKINELKIRQTKEIEALKSKHKKEYEDLIISNKNNINQLYQNNERYKTLSMKNTNRLKTFIKLTSDIGYRIKTENKNICDGEPKYPLKPTKKQ